MLIYMLCSNRLTHEILRKTYTDKHNEKDPCRPECTVRRLIDQEKNTPEVS